MMTQPLRLALMSLTLFALVGFTIFVFSCAPAPAFAQGVPPPPLPPGSFVLAKVIDKHGEEHDVRPPDDRPPENRPPDLDEELQRTIVLDNDIELSVVPRSDAKAFECNTTTAGTKAFSISFPTYPCIMQTTYEALDRSYEKDENGKSKRGFWTGKVPRAFLRIRLVTRGLFSAIAGLVGLG